MTITWGSPFFMPYRHIGVSTANMEEGSLRCDVNVSVRERAGEGRVGCARPHDSPAPASRSFTRSPLD